VKEIIIKAAKIKRFIVSVFIGSEAMTDDSGKYNKDGDFLFKTICMDWSRPVDMYHHE
jgi:hypothetical protein